jgi:hypothetical protein
MAAGIGVCINEGEWLDKIRVQNCLSAWLKSSQTWCAWDGNVWCFAPQFAGLSAVLCPKPSHEHR